MNYRILSRQIKLALCCCCFSAGGALALVPLRAVSSRAVGGVPRHRSWLEARDGDQSERQSSSSMKNVSALLNSMLERADRTLSCAEEVRPNQDDRVNLEAPVAVRDLLRGVRDDMSFRENDKSNSASSMSPVSSSDDDDDDDLLKYGDNPTITMTALAHTLWKSILRPGKDSAIDATAGNGGDATMLADLLLMPSTQKNKNKNVSHLVCIDIQPEACQATQASLSKVLTEDTLYDQVSIHHGSHAPLTLPPSGAGPVAVVAYNLGYLPGQERASDTTTTTETSTTLASLTDAVICLRMGGLLSVLTYPLTNAVEDAAVQAFLEGLALFSSRTQDWRDFLVEPDPVRYAVLQEDELRREIRQRLQYIHEELGARQCWRVH
eukprot:scaffold118_cov185-Amphora_coffeaeformis.AAC.18